MEFYKLIQRQMANRTHVLTCYDTTTNKTIVLQINANTLDDAKKIAKLQHQNITIID